MALLNNTCTYAIRATLYVAGAGPAPGAFVSTRKVADDLGVPFAFLTKVLQGLTQSGVLLSQRGAGGGVALARPAGEIALGDILSAVGGDGVFRECVLGLPACSDASPCALHQPWREQRAVLESLFLHTTVADLVTRQAGDAKAAALASLGVPARSKPRSAAGRDSATSKRRQS